MLPDQLLVGATDNAKARLAYRSTTPDVLKGIALFSLDSEWHYLISMETSLTRKVMGDIPNLKTPWVGATMIV